MFDHISTNNFSESDDWLQEEYDKIKKNQKLQSLQSKLENIKKKKESLNEMRSRVSKQKSNVTNKSLEFYFTKEKNKKEVGHKENLLEKVETPGSAEDGDLILEEVEEKEDSDEEEIDGIQDKEESVKVGIHYNARTKLVVL